MKKTYAIWATLLVTFGVPFLTACSSNLNGATEQTTVSISGTERGESKLIQVKYRDTPVNIADSSFETLDTSKSSFIRGAWYDSGNRYMVINLNGANYHYCDVPSSIWEGYKGADSYGTAYNKTFKGNFDCRKGIVLSY